jgi:hypothetical protein
MRSSLGKDRDATKKAGGGVTRKRLTAPLVAVIAPIGPIAASSAKMTGALAHAGPEPYGPGVSARVVLPRPRPRAVAS